MPRKGENIYKRKDGRWEGRYILSSETGKAKYGYVYAKSYQDVKSKLSAAKCKTLMTSSMNVNKEKFSFWLNSWLLLSKTRVKESTYVKYSNSIKNHIEPSLGKYELQNISTSIVEQFVLEKLTRGNLKSGKPLSNKTVSEFLIIIKDTLNYAQSEGIKVHCQLDRISVKKKIHEMRVLDEFEVQRLISNLEINIDRCKLGVLICLLTGIRIGELCALKWKNISLDEKFIRIDSTMQRLQYTTEHEISKTHIIITEPKSNAAIRIIPIQDALAYTMKAFQGHPESYLLTGSSKNYIEPRTMQMRFKSYLKESHINDANFHSLRHTFATRCIELGFDIKSLSEVLGHTSVRTTLDKYVHSSMERKRYDMNRLLPICE